MSDPALTLHKALFDVLSASTALRALVADRIYDEVPRAADGDVRAQKPYVTIGEDQVVADKAECLDGAEVFLTVHAWSSRFPELKRISDAIKLAIDANYYLVLDGHRLVDIEFESARHLPEPDGMTRHAVITFRALTERTDGV